MKSWITSRSGSSIPPSGATFLADSPGVSGVLALVTAVLAGSNAALAPSDKSSQHKAAAVAFATIWRKIQLAIETDLADAEVTDERFQELRQLFELCDAAIAQQAKDAPMFRTARPYEGAARLLGLPEQTTADVPS